MDVLSGGPERVGPPRRRWVAGLVAVAVAGAAAVLAARSTADRRDAAPDPAPTTSAQPLRPAVVGVAVGTRYAYALTADCVDRNLDVCSFQLNRREIGGDRWFPLPLRSGRRQTSGLVPMLRVTGEDVVTVLEQPNAGPVHASTDAGATVRSRPLRGGPPIGAVPPDGVLDLGLCDACAGILTVLDPVAAQLRPLAVQPPIGTAGLRSLHVAGGTIWVTATTTRDAPVTAVSTDRGRSWRAVPVRGFATGIGYLQVTAAPDGSAYLFGSRMDGNRPVAEVWRIDRPAGTWRRLRLDPTPPAAISALPVGGGLLLTDYLGHCWRLSRDGATAEVQDRRLAGLRIGPGVVAGGPAGLLIGMPIGEDVRNAVLVSTDDGSSWGVEQVVA